jgi:WD40 repeat protein
MEETMIRILLLVILGLVTGLWQPAQAAVPKNALGAIAVSPDGKTVLAAGDNRVLYVLDAKPLTVRKKLWIGVNPLSIHYSADGSAFALHDTQGTLKFYDAATLKVNNEVTGVEVLTVAEKADIIFTAGRPRGRGEEAKTPLRGYELATGKPVLDRTVNMAIRGLGADSDALRLFAISRPIKSATEKKQNPSSSLRGLERELFRQKNDGKVAQLVAFDINGKELGRHTSWFSTPRSAAVISFGKLLRIVTYDKYMAVFTLGSMDTRFVESKNSYNYGIGYSIGNNKLVTGGLGKGTIVLLDSGKTRSFQVDRIGGWPEYFKGFAIAADGTVYGGTTAYRLVRVNPDGTTKTVPVY